jgi:DNA-binding protein YbaB
MAGAGLISARPSGTGQLKAIRIDPLMFDRSTVAELEKLITAAVRNVGEKAADSPSKS